MSRVENDDGSFSFLLFGEIDDPEFLPRLVARVNEEGWLELDAQYRGGGSSTTTKMSRRVTIEFLVWLERNV